MDQLVQCPVCTLFLHNGMTLESHLDTHPKDQVIKALCSLTAKGSNYGSRTSTPLHSERSYRSRSRTPATEDGGRWNGSHRSTEQERYWRRTPSRTPKSNHISNVSRNSTPDIRINDMNFESSLNNPATYSSSPFVLKADKIQQTYQPTPSSDFDQQYVYYPEQQEDREVKYSRSAEYNAIDNSNNMFTYNVPTMGSGVKLLPAGSKRSNDLVKLLPKQNNILLKANVGGVQYISSGVKPMHVVVPAAPTFLQKNIQNNMIMTGNVPNTHVQIDTKTVAPPLTTNLNQVTSNTFTPSTTVVTQNSQIIYREMVHNIDGKPFITSMPTMLSGHDNVSNVAQASSMYQNVMVVDQFGNTSCMYTTPQQILPKACTTSIYNDSGPLVPNMHMEKPVANMSDPKTLIIEVGPIGPSDQAPASCEVSVSSIPHVDTNTSEKGRSGNGNVESKHETPGSSKGLKILSNIKVEVPVQHHKNMVNTIMDLTGPGETDYPVRADSPEKILPDLDENNQITHEGRCEPEKILPDFDDNNHNSQNTEPERILPKVEDNQLMCDESTQPSMSSADSVVSHTFSVIKNVGNPPSYKDANKITDSRMDTELSDSCPVPDLICNEKPSISPCSELSENGDNSTDRPSISPKPGSSNSQVTHSLEITEKNIQNTQRSFKHNTLRLNNIYVKKNKKVLQIKNAKPFPVSATSIREEPTASTSVCRSPENFSMTKRHQSDIGDSIEVGNVLHTISVEIIRENEDNNDFDADTEEQSMDIEPVAPSSINHSNEYSSSDIVHVKEEINTSNEGGFSNGGRVLTPLETLRPINVITYGNMSTGDFDDDSNDRELLDLETASKNKQFVSMMNENYFGDNIYADYFTPDRVESFDAVRESTGYKDGPKDGIYNIWGEPAPQKENEFVLPNFVHESYKIAESNTGDYSQMSSRERQGDGDGEGCERDSKVDLLSESRSESEAPLNICADERMPPRGELSGQESNGDMESPWTGMYTEITPAEPYDLIARESWVSDGSEMDANEKRDALEEDLQFTKTRVYTCSVCASKFPTMKDLRGHKALAHAAPAATYSRLVSARTIKKEDKVTLSNNLLTLDSKESITSTILKVYETMDDSKPKIEGLIKQETKRKRKDYVCATCKVDQVTNTAFREHLKIHPLECLTCGKCFFRRSNLALHIKTHLGIKNYKCDVCEKRFITRQKLMEHHNVHTGRAPFKCTVCDDTFRRYSNMVQHRDRHHLHKRVKVRDYVCACGGVFHSRAKLRWHQETHDGKPKACLYCSDKFVHVASLTRHVRRAHNEYFLADRLKGKPAENVPCPVCKQIYLRSNLRAHLQIHTGQRPFHCIICNKYFTTKWNLKLHRWTHMSRSSKPYKCNLCKGAFIRQTEYISHMNAHKSVRPYTCNYCGCQFIRKYNCQRHVREHEMAKKYVCKVPECGKSFHRSYYLSEHMKVHSGVRPFSCNICGKTSSNKSNHNKHVKIHHAREPVATEA